MPDCVEELESLDQLNACKPLELESTYSTDFLDPDEKHRKVDWDHKNEFQSNYVEIINEWNGKIDSIDDSTARCTLIDVKRGAYGNLEFDIEELRESDRHLCRKNALFYFFMGKYRAPHGQIFRVSEVRMRRFPKEEYLNSGLDYLNNNQSDPIWAD